MLVAMLVLWTFPLGLILWLVFRPSEIGPPSSPEDPDHELKERANAGLL